MRSSTRHSNAPECRADPQRGQQGSREPSAPKYSQHCQPRWQATLAAPGCEQHPQGPAGDASCSSMEQTKGSSSRVPAFPTAKPHRAPVPTPAPAAAARLGPHGDSTGFDLCHPCQHQPNPEQASPSAHQKAATQPQIALFYFPSNYLKPSPRNQPGCRAALVLLVSPSFVPQNVQFLLSRI